MGITVFFVSVIFDYYCGRYDLLPFRRTVQRANGLPVRSGYSNVLGRTRDFVVRQFPFRGLLYCHPIIVVRVCGQEHMWRLTYRVSIGVTRNDFSFKCLRTYQLSEDSTWLVFQCYLATFKCLLMRTSVISVRALQVQSKEVMDPYPTILHFPVIVRESGLGRQVDSHHLVHRRLCTVRVRDRAFQYPIRTVCVGLFHRFLVDRPEVFHIVLSHQIFPTICNEPSAVSVDPRCFGSVSLTALIQVVFGPSRPPNAVRPTPDLRLNARFVVTVLICLYDFHLSQVGNFPFQVVIVRANTTNARGA